MRRTSVRSLVAAVVLVAAAGIVVFGDWARAQNSAPSDSAVLAKQAAKDWALEIFKQIGPRANKDRRVTFQPMGESDLASRRHRRRLYSWLLSALHEQGTAMQYTVMNPMEWRDVSQALKEADVPNANKVYMETLRKHGLTKLNLSCKGIPDRNRIKLECRALEIFTGEPWGRASAVFELEWLNRPVALELAVRSFARDVVQEMKGSGRLGKTRVVDGGAGKETPLSQYVARMLEDEIHDRMRNYRGPRAVRTGKVEAAAYRVEGEIWRPQGKTVLRVVIQVGERRIPMGREYVAVTEDIGRESGGTPEDRDPAKVFLTGGISLADWVLVARARLEERLKEREYARLLAEANAHIRNYRADTDVKGVEEVRERTIAGLLEGVRLDNRADAPQALQQLGRIWKSAGERPALLRLMARAHRFLGDYKSEEEVHRRWLRAAPQDHRKRMEVVKALEMLAQHEKFAEMVGRPFSKDTAEGGVGWTDLHYAAVLDLPGVIAALVDGGMAVDTRLKAESSPPFGDDLKRTLAGLGHGDEFRNMHADGETPLMIALVVNARDAMKYLVGRGADVNVKNNDGGTPLHYAAERDAVKAAEYLVSQGADIHAKSNGGHTPLVYAAYNDAVKAAEYLVSQGADIHAKSKKNGQTPLHYAAWGDAVKVMEYLVSQGADIHAKDNRGDTPLHYAAYNDAVKVMEYLVSQGADIHAKDNRGDTPLHYAARGDAVKAAEYLVSQGADIHAKSKKNGRTPLHYAAWGDAVKVMEYLVSQGADIHAKDNRGDTPLHYAARGDAVKAAEYLVSQGADIHAKSKKNGRTPLHYAARGDAVKAAEYLVSQGADIHAKNKKNGDTPLHYAAYNDAVKVMEYLVGKGADIHAKDNSGDTPLHEAAWRDAVKAVEYLVGQGADIHAKDNSGDTPLHEAAWRDAVKAAEYLVGQGADIHAKDNRGDTPLHYAAWGDAVKVMEYLVSQGADIHAKDNRGGTPLHEAALGDAVKAVEYLVGQGADINAKDNDGHTPLHATVWRDAVKAAEYLVGKGSDIHAKNNDGETALSLAQSYGRDGVAKFLEDFAAKAGE